MSAAARTLERFLRHELGQSGAVPLHEPWIKGNAWAYVKECLDTGWVSTVGAFVTRFEEMCANACGVSHAVATVNGTSALHSVLVALGVGRGDYVLCPALSFVATANAIAYTGATPIFVDCDPVTLGVDPLEVKNALQTFPVAAIIPMHVFGHPTDIDGLIDAAEGVPVIEDAAEALGSEYKGRPCGGLGLAGVLSFNGNKIVTTGGGGMVLTNDSALAAKIRHVTTTARVGAGWHFKHDEVGYNYRLPNLNAALGCAQLENLPEFLSNKRNLALKYQEIFGDMFVKGREFGKSNAWLNALLLPDKIARDDFLEETNRKGIHTRPAWDLLPDLPMYAAAPRIGELPVARSLVERLVNIPSSPSLIG